LTSCGAIFKGFRSSTTKTINRSPYYTGKAVLKSGKVGHLPVTLDSRLQSAFMGMERRLLLIPLLEEMNGWLDSLAVTQKLEAIKMPIEEAPDIYVGNKNAFDSPVHLNGTDDKNKDERKMVIYKRNPSAPWKEQLSQVMANNHVDYVLFITIGFSEYFLRHKHFLGGVIVDMGTGYEISASWFSDLDTPAEVLQVSGAILDKEVKILRTGAKGIVARKTGFFSSQLGLQDMLSKEDLQKILNDERREDLQGSPLKWKVALQNLVAQLLNQKELIIR
jgi:hypothetical protein